MAALAGLGCRDFPPLNADAGFIAGGQDGGLRSANCCKRRIDEQWAEHVCKWEDRV